MIGTSNTFAHKHKADATYLDVAANDHGREKGMLVDRALARVAEPDPRVVEIGPGGGAAVAYLASRLQERSRSIHLTLIEAPGIASRSLTQAMDQFNAVGTCDLVRGWAQDIAALVTEPVDVISASALLHEVYSYGGAYGGLHTMMRTFPAVLKPYGFLVYRDVYAVDAASLHERAVQSYSSKSWLQFLRMFLPHYLRHGTHPYHHHDDEVVVRQNSRIVPAAELDTRVCAIIGAPIGLFREVQRHYITLRDHVWRSGALGFLPILDGQLSGDWIDFRIGHKRVHFAFADSSLMTAGERTNIQAVSEPYGDHHVIDGDIFDAVTDVALQGFLTAVERGDGDCAQVWSTWLEREGRETYAYLTSDELLTAFAVNSAETEAATPTVLLPVQPSDVFVRERHYYNRFLGKRLANPLTDAKQMALFQNIPITDSDALQQALTTIRQHCSKPHLARIHTAIHTRG
ncbi:hypothetical protein IU453_03025 [Nocardia cyriacigeorgica]|uniref:hypothetical protein n=1 Tax=Nocardia cyriacigeorgica TaxID=135487 RepID=UPI001895C577|nr:hypothetical protein [Nocardia cyriacigeorgica]MBF6315753.1 hypothetical protein [Nocardia cyriacigeorgica]MBF6530538.1 hypothetical protein [Nocardia cyriacigeorgica]